MHRYSPYTVTKKNSAHPSTSQSGAGSSNQPRPGWYQLPPAPGAIRIPPPPPVIPQGQPGHDENLRLRTKYALDSITRGDFRPRNSNRFCLMPEDVALTIADHLDPRGLAALAEAWLPMKRILENGQNSGHLAKMEASKFGMVVERPAVRSAGLEPLMKSLVDYCTRWTHLQFFNRIEVPLQSMFGGSLEDPEIVDRRSARPPGRSFQGESGGCFYVADVVKRQPALCQVYFYRPPSIRRGTSMASCVHSFSFSVCAIAIDPTQDLVVLLEQTLIFVDYSARDTRLHFHSISTGATVKEDFVFPASFWESSVSIGQFEIHGRYIGILALTHRDQTSVKPNRLQFFDTQTGELIRPASGPTAIHRGFHFISNNMVLIAEIHGHGQGPQVLLNYLSRQDRNVPGKNRYLTLPREFKSKIESTCAGRPYHLQFIPNVAPASGMDANHSGPFYPAPEENLVGMAFQDDYSNFPSAMIVDMAEILSGREPYAVYFDNVYSTLDDLWLNGRRFIYFRNGIVQWDFNKHASSKFKENILQNYTRRYLTETFHVACNMTHSKPNVRTVARNVNPPLGDAHRMFVTPDTIVLFNDFRPSYSLSFLSF